VERKKAQNFKRVSNSSCTQIKVEEIGKGKYYGFELEGEKEEDKLFFLEDFTIVHNCGKAPNLLDFADATMDSLSSGLNSSTGQIIFFGTGGGNNTDWEGFKEIFFRPSKYNCLEFENTWDENSLGTYCGLFIPDYWTAEGFMTDNGESLIELAKEAEIGHQEDIYIRKGDIRGLVARKMEHPLTPSEAFAISGNNIFDVISIREWRLKVEREELHTTLGNVGSFSRKDDGKLKFNINAEAVPFWDYPIQRDLGTTKSAVIIWKAPLKIEGKIPSNLYIVDVDTYRFDHSSGISVGACYVKIRSSNKVEYNQDDRIVAQYIGRPRTKDDFSKIVFELAEYYNAKIGYENDDQTLLDYAKLKRMDLSKWLEGEFQLAYDEKLKTSNSKVKRRYGMHIGSGKLNERKYTGDEYIKEWLETKRAVDDLGNIQLNLHTIYDIGLLKELESYNPEKGNFDRIAAFRISMYHGRELVYNRMETMLDEKKDNILQRAFFK